MSVVDIQHIEPVPIEPVPRLLLTYPQAAEATGWSVRTLEDLVRAGKIPHIKLGRAVRFSPDALREWIAGKIEGGV
ncbi:MAG: helix-turn-helix domain-containing protein [Pirellulales bacterium]|nr:helix-turn-helix domain-containing protein [Pirellulales bacterium]